ncbi:hypothetical protein BT96DRAFT_1008814 [Gymnopus androsaceus JB14]|uniref:Methyltransferase domain-containing protein n=1 Tax=Gymnopus androsaceus JB14 TaxID=1447944 RepID=A0A6A4GDY3_9AGAR|nr:hypothetical protein BT96DRAFT_1008814 [Gymnopus androsaceus JB14]
MTKEIQLNRSSEVNDNIALVYDAFALRYDQSAYEPEAALGTHTMKTDLVRDFDYSGPVLDVACGTGIELSKKISRG